MTAQAASRIGSVSLMLIVVSALSACHANRTWQSTPPNPTSNASTCLLGENESSGLNGDPSTDVHAIREYRQTIAQMLEGEQFQKLDCLAAHARSAKERFSGGDWKLHELYRGLSVPTQYPIHSTEEDWSSRVQQLQHWLATDPKSITGRIALAEAYVRYAADARGIGAPNTVSQSSWGLIAQRTAKAKRILERPSSIRKIDPEWYLLMLEVAENQHWNAAKTSNLFHKASNFEPGYFYYTSVLARNLLPNWGGKPGDAAKFLQESADHLGDANGDVLYFQVATDLPLNCECEQYDDPHLSLERMERGLDLAEQQYGISLVSLNRAAFIAFRSRPDDEVFAAKAFALIGHQWDEATWEEEDNFQKARNVAVFVGSRLNIEATAAANMKTPEGQRYQASFEKRYKELARQCVQPGDGVLGKFMTLTNVGATGTVEEIRIEGNNPAAYCLYEKLQEFQQEKATPFPPPPKAPYWVRLDLDWAEFARVAAK
jgi:hypothetical protein